MWIEHPDYVLYFVYLFFWTIDHHGYSTYTHKALTLAKYSGYYSLRYKFVVSQLSRYESFS
jgi:hypothetical protein